MKNNKGITLTSLVIYIALIFVVLAILMRITTHFSGSMADAANVSFETEFNKLNLYLLEESKQSGNKIQEIIDGTQITFTMGNKYTYNKAEKNIYLNDTIKICENIESCLFEEKTAENGKSILSLTIKINNIEKTVDYVMTSNSTISYNQLLPKEYQQVEYIESTGTQYIDTGVNGGEKMAFYIKLNTLGSYAISYEQYFAGDKTPKGVKLYGAGSYIAIQDEKQVDINAYLKTNDNTNVIEFTEDGTAMVNNIIMGEQISNNRLGRSYVLCV